MSLVCPAARYSTPVRTAHDVCIYKIVCDGSVSHQNSEVFLLLVPTPDPLVDSI
jgi:hypothetical protein